MRLHRQTFNFKTKRECDLTSAANAENNLYPHRHQLGPNCRPTPLPLPFTAAGNIALCLILFAACSLHRLFRRLLSAKTESDYKVRRILRCRNRFRPRNRHIQHFSPYERFLPSLAAPLHNCGVCIVLSFKRLSPRNSTTPLASTRAAHCTSASCLHWFFLHRRPLPSSNTRSSDSSSCRLQAAPSA